MAKILTVKNLHDYMINVGEDIFEDIEVHDLFEYRYEDFGKFLLKKYPDDEELKDVLENLEDGDGWWDFKEIIALREEDPATGIDILYSEFVEFCNKEPELVEAVFDIINESNQ